MKLIDETGEQELDIPDELLTDLKKIAHERNKDLTTVVLQAIATEVYLWKKVKKEKNKLFLQEGDYMTELIFT